MADGTGEADGGGDGTTGSTATTATADARTDATGGDDGPGRYSLVWRSVKTALGSDSYLMRSYALVGSLLAAFVVALVALAFPGWVARTLSGGGTATFSRAFLLLSGLLVVAPLLAPLVLAARRHRAGTATPRADLLFAASGYLFVGSLYVALLVSAPPDQRETPPDAIAPAVGFLYGLDPVFAVVPPVLAAALVFAVDRVV
ncbi:hypothetical protein BRD00_09560 [Halobacteriales archaeon QS_8_69_26]|nr:MAG: hypothetical protein BRD00_09560 [Halobacteriales archaeon QS_8_69_26]